MWLGHSFGHIGQLGHGYVVLSGAGGGAHVNSTNRVQSDRVFFVQGRNNKAKGQLDILPCVHVRGNYLIIRQTESDSKFGHIFGRFRSWPRAVEFGRVLEKHGFMGKRLSPLGI